jgi:hypothetical protein
MLDIMALLTLYKLRNAFYSNNSALILAMLSISFAIPGMFKVSINFLLKFQLYLVL